MREIRYEHLNCRKSKVQEGLLPLVASSNTTSSILLVVSSPSRGTALCFGLVGGVKAQLGIQDMLVCCCAAEYVVRWQVQDTESLILQTCKVARLATRQAYARPERASNFFSMKRIAGMEPHCEVRHQHPRRRIAFYEVRRKHACWTIKTRLCNDNVKSNKKNQ